MDDLMNLLFGIAYNNHDADLVGRDQVDNYTLYSFKNPNNRRFIRK